MIKDPEQGAETEVKQRAEAWRKTRGKKTLPCREATHQAGSQKPHIWHDTGGEDTLIQQEDSCESPFRPSSKGFRKSIMILGQSREVRVPPLGERLLQWPL